MYGATHPLPQYVIMAWCLVKYRGKFIFTFRPFSKIIGGTFTFGINRLMMRLGSSNIMQKKLKSLIQKCRIPKDKRMGMSVE
jgi:hypothetical protein